MGGDHNGSTTRSAGRSGDEGRMNPPEAGKSVPSPAPTPAAGSSTPPAQASIEDFQKLAFRVGTVVTAADHPNADRLLVVTVDIGEGQPRQVVAGIRNSYQAASLVGKQVVVVTNLKPAVLRGVESHGMLLAGSDPTQIVLVSPERPLPPGSIVK